MTTQDFGSICRTSVVSSWTISSPNSSAGVEVGSRSTAVLNYIYLHLWTEVYKPLLNLNKNIGEYYAGTEAVGDLFEGFVGYLWLCSEPTKLLEVCLTTFVYWCSLEPNKHKYLNGRTTRDIFETAKNWTPMKETGSSSNRSESRVGKMLEDHMSI